MGMLVKGEWSGPWVPANTSQTGGRFVRANTSVRNWVTPGGQPGPTGEGGFVAEWGRYHLYAAFVCPWASRALIYRKLKGLDSAIGLTIVNPRVTDLGWRFGGHARAAEDTLYGATYLHELYTRHDPRFSGRVTVPMLWDTQREVIVNNESADIVRMLNSGFGKIANDVDFYPEPLRADIDAINALTYEGFNNGVYRAGFAGSQAAYEEAYHAVFESLDTLERLLKDRPYLLADRPLECDWRVFVTLIRFDIAYHALFKCNLRRLIDYPYLWRYTRRLYNYPGVSATVDLDHIKAGYYAIKALNPSGIIPCGPALNLSLSDSDTWPAAP